MSINIPTGRLIAAPIGRAYDMLLAAKADAKPIGRSMELEWMTGRAVKAVDDARMAGTAAEHPLHKAWRDLLDAQSTVRRSGTRNPSIDFEFELWLFPLGRRTLIKVHTEQGRFLSWFDGLPFVQDYAYWDSTDRDDAVPPRQWSRRRREWNAVMPVGRPPSDRCLTMVMYNDQTPWTADPEEALRYVDPIAKRLAEAARARHVDEVYKAMVEEKRQSDPEWQPKGFQLFFDAERVARHDAARRQEIADGIAPAIREITAADLQGE